MSGKPKMGNVKLKNNAMKRLGKNIGGVHDARSMNDYEKFGFNVGTYEMVANVDMFGLPVIGVIGGKGLGTIIISADDER